MRGVPPSEARPESCRCSPGSRASASARKRRLHPRQLARALWGTSDYCLRLPLRGLPDGLPLPLGLAFLAAEVVGRFATAESADAAGRLIQRSLVAHSTISPTANPAKEQGAAPRVVQGTLLSGTDGLVQASTASPRATGPSGMGRSGDPSGSVAGTVPATTRRFKVPSCAVSHVPRKAREGVRASARARNCKGCLAGCEFLQPWPPAPEDTAPTGSTGARTMRRIAGGPATLTPIVTCIAQSKRSDTCSRMLSNTLATRHAMLITTQPPGRRHALASARKALSTKTCEETRGQEGKRAFARRFAGQQHHDKLGAARR